MKFYQLCEVYSKDNMNLKHYLNSRSIEFNQPEMEWLANEFLNQDENEDILKELEKIAKNKIDLDDLNYDYEDYVEYFYKLPKPMMDRIEKEIYTNHVKIYREIADETPSIYHFDDAKLIHRMTWLIHFTNDPFKIKKEGFKFGNEDMARLGLTVFKTKESKKFGGYNFAFESDSREASRVAKDGKYGEHAVMFRNSGIKAYHWGDSENQVIFWGKDVKPSDIIILYKDDNDDWTVTNYDEKVLYKNKSFDRVEKWVRDNFDQYRKQF